MRMSLSMPFIFLSDANGLPDLLCITSPDYVWLNNTHPDGWQIYEPAKFANVKVNQYVKLSNGEQVRVHENNNLKQELVLWTLDNNWFGYADYEGNIYHLKGKLTIVHIIPPDEMRVKITLETIIKKDETRDDFFWAYINGLWICMDINKIPPDQAEQVMALLKAQEGK